MFATTKWLGAVARVALPTPALVVVGEVVAWRVAPSVRGAADTPQSPRAWIANGPTR